jgi:hypothetical protein
MARGGVSEALAEPVDAHAPAIDNYSRGRARDFRKRAAAEDLRYVSTIERLIAPLSVRMKRYPRRRVRPETLAALVEGWRFMDARNFRLDLTAKMDRTSVLLTELRVCASQMQRAEWDSPEHDLSIHEVGLLINGTRDALMQTRCVACFSIHSIARYLQRHAEADGEDSALLWAMALVAKADINALEPGGWKVTTDQFGGGWRGRTTLVETNGRPAARLLSIRTWLDS